MKSKKLFVGALNSSKEKIKDITFLCETRCKESYFTRPGKIGFVNLIAFMLNFNKRSMQLELDEFFKETKGTRMTITKQAFSEARQKILPKAFTILNEEIVKLVYSDDFNRYKGHRLLAVDGSVLTLNNTEVMRNSFGYVENKTSMIALAQASALYDMENDIIVNASIDRYETNERDMAQAHVEVLIEKYGLENDLILFDRGYPSKKLIAFLTGRDVNYVMRVKTGFLKEINKVTAEDEVVEIKHEGRSYKIRVIKVLLDNGEEETLISSILGTEFSVKEFKDVYFKRWGIEGKYDELKNRLQIENFSGETELAIKQDFYASIYLSNMVALAKADANEEICERNEGKDLKYEYQVNTNILIGKLKDKMILMLLEDNKNKRSKMFDHIMGEIVRNTIPIRPGRQNERKKKGTKNKYHPNQRRCL